MYKYLFIISLLFPIEDQFFKINFLGIPAAEVELSSIDTVFNGEISRYIHFKTHSTSLFTYLFNIDNKYKTITTQDMRTILSFNKNTIQPNVENTLKTSIYNNQVVYDHSSAFIPKNHFNIFSLLYFLSQNKIINTQNVNIEREGLFYSGIITPIEILEGNKILYDLKLDKNELFTNLAVIQNTDIFTWALFKDNAKRKILVDYNNNNIIECRFTSGMVNMTAKNIKY